MRKPDEVLLQCALHEGTVLRLAWRAHHAANYLFSRATALLRPFSVDSPAPHERVRDGSGAILGWGVCSARLFVRRGSLRSLVFLPWEAVAFHSQFPVLLCGRKGRPIGSLAKISPRKEADALDPENRVVDC